MFGISLGVMAILCAVGLVGGGGLLTPHEGKGSKDQPAIQRGQDNGKAAEFSQGKLTEDKRCGTILLVPKGEVLGE